MGATWPPTLLKGWLWLSLAEAEAVGVLQVFDETVFTTHAAPVTIGTTAIKLVAMREMRDTCAHYTVCAYTRVTQL